MSTSFSDVDACAARLVEYLSGRIRIALPLGLGKPVQLINALYRRACADPGVELSIFTALTLERPAARSELERRLLGPIFERLYQSVPDLEYVRDLRKSALPANVTVEEFYVRPGAWLTVPVVQQNYVSTNYTHAARDLHSKGINVIAQLVAPDDGQGESYSLGCNPDVTLDLLDLARNGGGSAPLLVGEINPALPFMYGDAVLAAGEFDMLVESDSTHYPLFPVPNRFVPLAEQIIAIRVAALIVDGGTLQIGIGSIGDAVAWAIGMRHQQNATFRAHAQALEADGATDDLPTGLYGMSEMFVEGFLHLHTLGVLRRTVDTDIFLHAGFFLGSAGFYEKLRQLPVEVRRGINMTRISYTNSLLGDVDTKFAQRTNARFVNTAMMVTLLGAVVSDGLADGRVVSGVGGQYNFVAMAHELPGGRSVIVLPSTRTRKGKVTSNIVWNYAHTTIPRHLRDIVVTEYGTADLRGASDSEVIIRLLGIADSRFQEDLRLQAVASGKLAPDYRLPDTATRNTPEVLSAAISRADLLQALPFYPIGSDYTDTEAQLAVALSSLAEHIGNKRALLKDLANGWRCRNDTRLKPALTRIGLEAPRSLQDRFYRLLVAAALDREVFRSGRPLNSAASSISRT
ncbi:MAG: acetyl-CoA hydrolase/transferase C-terminal domain-containing protein [Pseudomonadales bacterium]